MYIKCWGSRGSIPVSGRQYLKYGGDTTCLELRTCRDDIVIVDAGTGIRRLGNQLLLEERYDYHFIMTHAHWDHLMGFPFFKPLYLKQTNIQMHRCPFPKKYMENVITKVMTPPHFPVKYAEVKSNIRYEEGAPELFNIHDMTIEPIHISHPNTGRGYKFTEEGKVFVFLTDNELEFVHPRGLSYDRYVEFCRGADLLIHDAEYTPEEYKVHVEWGHSKYTDALQLALDAGVKRLGLFHLNQDRHDDEMDAIVEICNKQIAASSQALDCFGVTSDMILDL